MSARSACAVLFIGAAVCDGSDPAVYSHGLADKTETARVGRWRLIAHGRAVALPAEPKRAAEAVHHPRRRGDADPNH